MQDPEAGGVRRVAVGHLDRGPGPLPHADARRPGEPDRPPGALDRDRRPGPGEPGPVGAVRAQHLGEDGDGVVALEGDEGGLLAQPFAQRRPDAGAERA